MVTVRMGALVILLLCGAPHSVLTQLKVESQLRQLAAGAVPMDRFLSLNTERDTSQVDPSIAGDEQRSGHVLHMVPRSSDVVGYDAAAGDIMRRNGAAKHGGNFVRIGRADYSPKNLCLAQYSDDAVVSRNGHNDLLACLMSEIVKSYADKYGLGGQVFSGVRSQVKRNTASGSMHGSQAGGVVSHNGKFVRIGRYVAPKEPMMTSPAAVLRKLKRSSRENRFVRIGRMSSSDKN